ncbi:hypothetical protein [Cellulosimicrobium protaetiae]|uniref:Uncharacterized protein n=1 Tax=Cellulosimicrobium protaetiae TaxID=2587808 RepID=A0A6M5UEW0_9MICO|nr:hypothetical protein [Cellulosimicrobium protaetiae]QJW36730.1 hypothetical protein FIC82_011550 [Cellulosimicrobium protaetiae]
MITHDEVRARSAAADDTYPLLTLDEFFDGNAQEDSIAPNQWGFGRPPLAEIARRLRELERDDAVAWVRVQLHEETFEDSVEDVLAEGVAVCTTLDERVVDERLDAEELQYDGAFEGFVYDEQAFTQVPAVPEGYRVLSLVWD